MQKNITPATQKMIKAKGLAEVLSKVLEEIQALQLPGPETPKVEVEWAKDPEIDGWEMLSVTLWCQGSPDQARNLWGKLDQAMNELRQKLSKVDLEKLNRFVSVGVDVE
ncbi:MAG: hypothetical protein EXR54_06555 [Dehalococcoidia bacterium]|nr:hypothetical protein [Dehalococcoidia bacterium]MSQ17213.1 hypothetical protein [Dehalococcoidia bacterium]